MKNVNDIYRKKNQTNLKFQLGLYRKNSMMKISSTYGYKLLNNNNK